MLQDDADSAAKDAETVDKRVFEPDKELLKLDQTGSVSSPHKTETVVTATVPGAPVIQIEKSSFDSLDKSGEEAVIKVSRPTGTGLGISIAGGIGSSPYKDNDEVICCYAA